MEVGVLALLPVGKGTRRGPVLVQLVLVVVIVLDPIAKCDHVEQLPVRDIIFIVIA